MSVLQPPTILSLKRHAGIAGQFRIEACVQSDGEEPRTVSFVGSTYGGPVVMQTGRVEVFVSEPDRFGRFGEGWVRRFFA